MSEVLSSCRSSPLTCSGRDVSVSLTEEGQGSEQISRTDFVPESEVVRVLHLVLRDELADRGEGVKALEPERLARQSRADGKTAGSTLAALHGRPLALTASCMFRAV